MCGGISSSGSFSSAERLISSISRRCSRTLASSSLSVSSGFAGCGRRLVRPAFPGSTVQDSVAGAAGGASIDGRQLRRDDPARCEAARSCLLLRRREPSFCISFVQQRLRLRLAAGSASISFLSWPRDVVARLDLVERHAAVDRLAHQRVVVRDGAGEDPRRAPARCRPASAPEANIRCSKRLTMTCGLRPVAEPLADRGDQSLGLAQARHRHFADDEQLVGAEQHAVGPGEPGARHVDHDVVEIATTRDRAAASPCRDRRCASRPAGSAPRSPQARRRDATA